MSPATACAAGERDLEQPELAEWLPREGRRQGGGDSNSAGSPRACRRLGQRLQPPSGGTRSGGSLSRAA
eukprot:9803670-Heterocapsa_arctica.AAC.1